MSEILPSKLGKCCFRYDLIIGCAVYATTEIYLWAILSLTAIYTEFKMIENRDVGAFKNFTINSSYYITAFGNCSDDIGRTDICKFVQRNVYDVSMEKVCITKVFKSKADKKKEKSIFLFFYSQLHKLQSTDSYRWGLCFIVYLL
jgi:hypothetical protein